MADQVAHEYVDNVIVGMDHRYTDKQYSIDYQIASPSGSSYARHSNLVRH